MPQATVSIHASRKEVGAPAAISKQTRCSMPDAQSNQAQRGGQATPMMGPLVLIYTVLLTYITVVFPKAYCPV